MKGRAVPAHYLIVLNLRNPNLRFTLREHKFYAAMCIKTHLDNFLYLRFASYNQSLSLLIAKVPCAIFTDPFIT